MMLVLLVEGLGLQQNTKECRLFIDSSKPNLKVVFIYNECELPINALRSYCLYLGFV
jgi:hypothetical protein